MPAFAPGVPILGTTFAALLFRGATLYTRTLHDRVRPLVVATLIVCAVRLLALRFVSEGTSQILGSMVITVAVGGSCWVLLNPRDHATTPWERVLASAFPAVAIVSWYYAAGKVFDLWAPPSVLAWLVAGVLLCSLKTGALVARSQEQMEALRTRARNSEDGRRQIEARYRELAENASDLIAEIDAEGRIRYANPAFLDILGFEPRSLIGRSATELLIREPPPGLRSQRRGERIEAQTFAVAHADGRAVTLECHLRRIDLPGSRARVIATARDVTARMARDLESLKARTALEAMVAARTDALRSSLAELQRAERLASLGTMAAGIAHQINNPIGSIQLSAEFALSTGPGEAEREKTWRDALENAVEQSRRCGRIVASMLQFARNEPTRKEPEDLAAVLRRACGQTERYATSRGARIEATAIESPLPVLGSAIELEQAILNVLRNACESADAPVLVRVEGRRVGERAVVTIRDDGRGMRPEELEHIFDPFFTTRLDHGGTGLGLSVAHGVVTDHEGLLAVDSQPGLGTSVQITLPLLPEPGSPMPASADVSTS